MKSSKGRKTVKFYKELFKQIPIHKRPFLKSKAVESIKAVGKDHQTFQTYIRWVSCKRPCSVDK